MNKLVAEQLLDIKALQIQADPEDYFTWTSGILSPIYCDNRLSMSFPSVRKNIVKAFVKIIEENQIEIDVIAGCATAGIPHAAFLAEELDLPMVYVRSDKKAHGKGNQIEGVVHKGQKVLVIEDLISTGGSAINVAKVLEEAGASVSSILAIFTYKLKKAEDNFKKANFSYQTITNFDDIVELLTDKEDISPLQKEELLSWRNEL